jgi:exodeoxyribonuclease VII large subunit
MVVHCSVKTPTAAAEWLIERMAQQVEKVARLRARLQQAMQYAVTGEKNKIHHYLQRISNTAQRLVMQEQNRLQVWNKTIELHSPERIFNMGYSLTILNGKPVINTKDIKKGDILTTYVQDGVIESVVKD